MPPATASLAVPISIDDWASFEPIVSLPEVLRPAVRATLPPPAASIVPVLVTLSSSVRTVPLVVFSDSSVPALTTVLPVSMVSVPFSASAVPDALSKVRLPLPLPIVPLAASVLPLFSSVSFAAEAVMFTPPVPTPAETEPAPFSASVKAVLPEPGVGSRLSALSIVTAPALSSAAVADIITGAGRGAGQNAAVDRIVVKRKRAAGFQLAIVGDGGVVDGAVGAIRHGDRAGSKRVSGRCGRNRAAADDAPREVDGRAGIGIHGRGGAVSDDVFNLYGSGCARRRAGIDIAEVGVA